jgi:hypothetical protein
MDNDGRLAVSPTVETPSRYTALPISEQRADFQLTRQLTNASLTSLSKNRIVSIDNSGTVARIWRVPALPKSAEPITGDELPLSTTEACPAVDPKLKKSYCSAQNKWAAVVSREAPFKIEVKKHPKDAETFWDVSVDSEPRGVQVSADGNRLLMLFGDAVWYVDKSHRDRLHKTQRAIRDAAFGPGPDRVTLLTDDEIMIYSPESWTSDIAEWQAACAGRFLSFVRKADESSVLLYSNSKFWVYRLRQGSSLWSGPLGGMRSNHLWPDVTIIQTKLPVQRSDFRRLDNGDFTLVQDGEQVDESEGNFISTTRFSGNWSLRHWLATLTVRGCHEEANQGQGDWRSTMCEWERVSGRRVGTLVR